MGRGDRPRLSPATNVVAACAVTVTLMAWLNPGQAPAPVPTAPGPVAWTGR